MPTETGCDDEMSGSVSLFNPGPRSCITLPFFPCRLQRSYSSQIEPHSHVNFRPRFSYGDKRDITALATDIQSVRQLSVSCNDPQ